MACQPIRLPKIYRRHKSYDLKDDSNELRKAQAGIAIKTDFEDLKIIFCILSVI
jgi:hypothetical protein